ncbi:MAG: hypothetical protein ABI968_09950 [Acidobacteriota bacterium]
MTTISFRRPTAVATIVAFGTSLMLSAGPMPDPTPTPQRAAGATSPHTRLQIAHDPLTCVTTVAAPVVQAQVQPGPDLASSYVYFRAAGTPYFYYVLMMGPVPEVKGVLPRPLPETRALDYFVQATDKASLSRKTAEYAPPVVDTGVCKVEGLAVGKDGAQLTVGMTDANAPAIPPGFNKKDIAMVILVSGAVVTAAAASSMRGSTSEGSGTSAGAGAAGATGAAAAGAGPGAAGGTAAGAAAAGGGGHTALIVGGLVVAAGVGIGIGVSNSSSNNPTALPTNTPVPPPTQTPTPVVNRFIQVEATWSGAADVDVALLDPSSQSMGQVLPAGCESDASRTERVVLQGTNLPSGTYQVRLTGKSCPGGPGTPIPTLLNAVSDTGPKSSCQNLFVNVPVGGSITGCSFTVP